MASFARGARCENLGSGNSWQRFRPVLATLAPGAESGDGYLDRQGEDFLFVLRGTLHVEADGASLHLSEGDALYLGIGTPYRWRNGPEGETLLLLVSSP